MTTALHIRHALGLWAITTAACPTVAIALSFNNGRDKLALSAEYALTYDSNLFSRAGSEGDSSHSLSLSAEYSRRAGLIGMDASTSVVFGRFQTFSSEDFSNPSLHLEFNKQTGRLTGSLGLLAQKENLSETAINVRTVSWNYESTLNLRYPINDRYYFKTASGFHYRDYRDNSALFDLSSISQSVDVFYVYSSKLNLAGGYRLRLGEASGGARTQDHSITVGATDQILPKLSGDVRVGYQWRKEQGLRQGRFGALTTSVSLAWPATSKLIVNIAASKDYSTTATDVSVDVAAFSLSASYKPVAKLSLNAGVSYSISDYLGRLGGGREDRAFSYDAKLSYAFTSIISSSISYSYLDNDSNSAFPDFARHTTTFNLSARF